MVSKGYLSTVQKEFHEELTKMGFVVHTVRSLDELMNTLTEFNKGDMNDRL
jgi:hypothetical protein